MRQAAADYMQEHPELSRDLFKYQEKLSQLAPIEVPRMGFPVVPLVQAGLAAWTVLQCWKTGKNMVNDPKVQKSWEERQYIDIFKHAVPHLPVFGDAMRGGRALALGDSKEAWLYPANALFTIYGGKVIGKGSALLLKKIAPEINKLRCGRWLNKQGTSTVKGASVSKTNTLGSTSKKIPKARPIAKTDINDKGIKKIKAHLSKMDLDKANEVMIKRLEKIASGELKPTKTDLRFYTHELREQKLMKLGMTYEEAHAQALKDYGIEYIRGYESNLYTKEAIRLGEQGFRNE